VELARWILRSTKFFVPYAVIVTASIIVIHDLIDPVTDLDETWTWIVAYYAGLVGTTALSVFVLLRGRA